MIFLKKANAKYQVVAAKTPKEKFMDNMVKDILAVRKSKGQELVKFEARLRKLSFDKLQDMYKKEVGKAKLEYRESGKPYVLKAEAVSEPVEISLHTTFQPNIYYVSFDKLPKEAQKKLENADVKIENSRYTVYEDTAFIRAKVEVNGKLWDAEISLGSVDIQNSDYKWNKEKDAYEDEQGRPIDSDKYAEQVADELRSTIELKYTDVYLTFIKDLD